MKPVVLSGGSGTRLWPVSRKKFPKQFCEIFTDSLQSMTLKRLAKLGVPDVVTNHELKILTEIHVKKSHIKVEQIIYEPFAKNTAPAVLISCWGLAQRGLEKECVGFFPSDHLIQDEEEFLQAVHLAEKTAESGRIVILGVRPTYPETGYGYIQKTKKNLSLDLRVFGVVKFHEKPDLAKARRFLASQEYLWNAGIFVGTVETFLKAFKIHQPQMWEIVQGLKADYSNLKEIYEKFENLSIDYAIMEKMSEADLSVIPVDLGWNDVGSWDAVAAHFRAIGLNEIGTSVVDTDLADQNFVFSQTGRTVSFVDVNNLIVVDTPDGLLISQKGSTQNVRKIVEKLAAQKSKLVEENSFEERPWGQFETLRDSESFKSKVIRVSPQSQISYQSHSKRAEHWIITSGSGEVVLNDETIQVKAGSHVFIPIGAKHRIRNNTDSNLEFVEVQLGSYFGEDDIVRYQDDYKRI
jgi:mannose-1-phosphate guanylyltransferase/mannose-6-phosphate isomerase